MRISLVSTRKISLVILAFMGLGHAHAGGLLQYEIGSPDLGLASAGYAARAQDAATAMTNPAGMTRLCENELMVGIQPLYSYLEFSPDSNTTISGNDGGNAISWFPGGGGFFVFNATDNLKLGLSAYGNFGLPLHYDGAWVGRYYVTEATLLGMTVAPSVAFRIHDMWSVGVAVNAMYGILSQKANVNNSPLGIFGAAPDGELKLSNTTWGYGVTIGFLFEPTDCTRFGFTYTTETKLDFEDTIEFTNTFPIIIPGGSFSAPIDLHLTVPRQVMGSFYHELCSNWAILGNIGWQNWERFGQIQVTVAEPNPRTLTTKLNYDDTWHVAFGGQYDYSELFRLTVGVAYDTNMIPNGELTVNLPVGSALRLGTGAQYFMCENFTIGAGYTLLIAGNMNVDQDRGILTGRVSGDYDNATINYFGINFDWKF